LGEMPSCMNWFSVGVRSRYRKSARKPSREIRIVVGAKSEVPLDIMVAASLISWGVESSYVAARRTTKRTTIAT
jgi:hypothetical protein